MTSWLFGLMTAVAFVVVGRKISSAYIGLIAVVVLSLDRFYMTFVVRSMSESIVNFLTLLFLIACLAFFERDRANDFSRDNILAVVGVAATIALLTLAKPSGPLAGVVFSVLAAAYYALALRGKSRGELPGLALRSSVKVLVLVAAVGFHSIVPAIVLNPYLHDRPHVRIANTLKTWDKHVEAQQEREAGSGLQGLGDKLDFYARHCFPVSLDGKPIAVLLNVTLLGLGVVYLGARGARKAASEGRLSPELIFLVWGSIYNAVQLYWIPLRWPRYVLVAHPFVILAHSAAIYLLISGIVGAVRRARGRKSRP